MAPKSNPLVFFLFGSLALACTGKRPETAQNDTSVQPEALWPEWAFHHWVWEDESTQDSVMEMVDGYADADIPVGAVIIDSPWATGYNTFEWDKSLFPDPQGMIDDLHERDIRVFVWVVPAINVDVKDLYEEAATAGYFMQRDAKSGPAVIEWWKGQGSLIDYFNPEAVEWWHTLLQPTLDLGIDGWKCDGLDFSSLTAAYSPGAGGEVERIAYSHAYYQDFYDHTRAELGDDRLITARPIDNYGAGIGGDPVAFAPIDINWAGWVGDQDATFDGLEAALDNMYWSSEYGYLSFGSDIGGYREEDLKLGRTAEVLIRWAQVGALNPIMENGGAGAHWPWLFEEELPGITDIYRDFTNLHYDLLPYLHEQGAIAYSESRSLMTFTSTETYAYLLGDDVFVAPMLASGTTLEVTFPDGQWVYAFGENTVYEGGTTHTLQVPITEAAVFARLDTEVEDTLIGD